MAHAERAEDALRGKGTERLTRGAAHDHRQEKEAGIAVEVLGAGLEVRGLLAREDGEGITIAGDRLFLNPAPAQQVYVVPEPAGVVQQVPDGDRSRVARNLREVFLDLVVQRQLAILGEQYHGERGELLGDRADVEDGAGGNRAIELNARQTI